MFRTYDKFGDVSFTFGAFPTLELIKSRPADVVAIALHSKFQMTSEVDALLRASGVRVITDDRMVERVAKKGNVFMVAEFKKREYPLSAGSHIALVSPSDSGNLGTIIRTAVGFGINNLVLIGDAVDVFDPKVIRSSMGALFQIGIKRYANFADYNGEYAMPKYLFMLDGNRILADINPSRGEYSLVFGNESSGLPSELAVYGQCVRIAHTSNIDSLALPQAVAIGIYHFTKKQF